MKPEGVSLARTPFSSRGRSGRRRRLRGGMGLTAVRRARPRRELPGAGGKRHPPPPARRSDSPRSRSAGERDRYSGLFTGILKWLLRETGPAGGPRAGREGTARSCLSGRLVGEGNRPQLWRDGGRAGGVGRGGALCWAAAPGTGGKGDAGGRVMAPGAGGRVGCGPSLAAAACPAATRRAAPRADTPPPSSSPASAFAASATAAGRGRCRRAGRSTSGRSPSARWPWTSTWAAWGCTARWRPRTLPASSEPSRSRWAAGRHRSRPRGAAPAPQALGGAGRAGGG